jgi:hypothetical protein
MSKRFGSSVMSAVSNRGSARWMVYKGALDSALLLWFLGRLVRSMKGRKVYPILDNLRVHHSKPVKAWLEEHQEVIAVHHLPSYSPELNPDERLNGSLKSTLSHLPLAKDDAACKSKSSAGRSPARSSLSASAPSSTQTQLSMQQDILSLCRITNYPV